MKKLNVKSKLIRRDTDDEVTSDLIIPINKLIINGDNAKARELVVEKLPELTYVVDRQLLFSSLL
jgi:hypothetical protein